MEGSRNQDGHSVLLGAVLNSGGHVHVWRQVTGVNFEERTDGSLNGPTLMQTEAHLHAETRDSFLKFGVLSILQDGLQFIYLC